jgi:hypothetical protein
VNLLEVPVLFYVACLTLHATNQVDPTALYLAWGYVALRIAHSLVHLSYNKVLHRGALFGASNFILMIILPVFTPSTAARCSLPLRRSTSRSSA